MSIPQDAISASDFWTFLTYMDSASIRLRSRLRHLSQIVKYLKGPLAKVAIFPIVKPGSLHVLPLFPPRLAVFYRALPSFTVHCRLLLCAATTILSSYVTVATVESYKKLVLSMRDIAYVSQDKTLVHMLAFLRELAPTTMAARVQQPAALHSPEKRGSMNTYPNFFTRIPISSLMYTLIPGTFNYPYEGDIVGPLPQLPFGYLLDAPAYLLGCVNGSASSRRWQHKFTAMAARVRRKFRRRSDAVQTPAANLQLMKGGIA